LPEDEAGWMAISRARVLLLHFRLWEWKSTFYLHNLYQDRESHYNRNFIFKLDWGRHTDFPLAKNNFFIYHHAVCVCRLSFLYINLDLVPYKRKILHTGNCCGYIQVRNNNISRYYYLCVESYCTHTNLLWIMLVIECILHKSLVKKRWMYEKGPLGRLKHVTQSCSLRNPVIVRSALQVIPNLLNESFKKFRREIPVYLTWEKYSD